MFLSIDITKTKKFQFKGIPGVFELTGKSLFIFQGIDMSRISILSCGKLLGGYNEVFGTVISIKEGLSDTLFLTLLGHWESVYTFLVGENKCKLQRYGEG